MFNFKKLKPNVLFIEVVIKVYVSIYVVMAKNGDSIFNCLKLNLFKVFLDNELQLNYKFFIKIMCC